MFALTSPAAHTSLVSARLVTPICSSSGVAFEGSATGDLTGSFEVAFDCNAGRIVGGSWRLAVVETGNDGAATEVGAITGRVREGSFQANGAGEIYVVDAVALEIQQGRGRYASVSGGTGTLGATIDPNADPQVRGSLDLDF